MENKNFQKFEIITLKRNKIKKAPYNPRVISDEAKKKLRNNIKSVGLLTPLVWNKNTGNLVSGHQRLSALDSLYQTDDYEIKVACVDLDEKTEKEQNIFFNNPDAQGDWDMGKLEAMLKNENLNINNSGFDTQELCRIFGFDIINDNQQALEEMSKRADEFIEATEKSIREIEKTADKNCDFYCVVVFEGNSKRKEFFDLFNMQDERFFKGSTLIEKLKSFK
jgi:hypothetical protein